MYFIKNWLSHVFYVFKICELYFTQFWIINNTVLDTIISYAHFKAKLHYFAAAIEKGTVLNLITKYLPISQQRFWHPWSWLYCEEKKEKM